MNDLIFAGFLISLSAGVIPIGVCVPETGTENEYDLPYRMIKMAIEQPVRGKNDVPNYQQLGHLPGFRYQAYYANTAGMHVTIDDARA